MLSSRTFMLLGDSVNTIESKPHLEKLIIDFDGTIFLQLGLFLILYFVLKRLVFTPYLRMKEQRAWQTEGSVQETKELQSHAARLENQYEQAMKQAQTQAEKERVRFKKEQQEQNQQILAEVKSQMEQKWEAFQKDLNAQMEQALQNVEKQAPILAKQMATQILGRGVEE